MYLAYVNLMTLLTQHKIKECFRKITLFTNVILQMHLLLHTMSDKVTYYEGTRPHAGREANLFLLYLKNFMRPE